MNFKVIALCAALLSANYIATRSVAQETTNKTAKPKEMVKDTKDMTLVDQKNSQTDAPEWQKYGIPGEAHKALDAIAGKFNYTSSFRMDSKGKWITSSGTSESKWILDGRFVEQQFEGKMGDHPFTGIGITGYDTFRKEYQTVWMDSTTTSMFYSAGKGATDFKSFETTGLMSDPMRNDPNRTARTVTKILNANEHVFEMYSKDSAGKEYRCMEIKYKRVK